MKTRNICTKFILLIQMGSYSIIHSCINPHFEYIFNQMNIDTKINININYAYLMNEYQLIRKSIGACQNNQEYQLLYNIIEDFTDKRNCLLKWHEDSKNKIQCLQFQNIPECYLPTFKHKLNEEIDHTFQSVYTAQNDVLTIIHSILNSKLQSYILNLEPLLEIKEITHPENQLELFIKIKKKQVRFHPTTKVDYYPGASADLPKHQKKTPPDPLNPSRGRIFL